MSLSASSGAHRYWLVPCWSHKLDVCIEITTYHECVSQFVFDLLKEIPTGPCGADAGVRVCFGENQEFVSLIWFFYSSAPQIMWACVPLIQVRGGHCLAKIASNNYCHTKAMVPLNDCEVLKHL